MTRQNNSVGEVVSSPFLSGFRFDACFDEKLSKFI